MTAPLPSFAVHPGYLNAVGAFPDAAKRSLLAFMLHLRSGGVVEMNAVEGARDRGMGLATAGLAYTAVLWRTDREAGPTLLLWVGAHAAAADWARAHGVLIQPETGELQLFAWPTAEAPPAPPNGPFAALTEDTLGTLGVPAPWRATVRALPAVAELEGLPLDPAVREALRWHLEGVDPAEIAETLRPVEGPAATEPTDDAGPLAPSARAADPEPTDDPDSAPLAANFAAQVVAALASEATRGRFAVVTEDADLSRMMAAPLESWRVFLHPTQRALVERDHKGPVRVLGGAGTGKTVAALHRVRWLLRHRLTQPTDRILFTTFTANLAVDLSRTLDSLLPPADRARVDVRALSAFVSDLLRTARSPFTVAFWGSREGRLEALWNEAVAEHPVEGFSPTFLREEWTEVVQARRVDSRGAYLLASRAGRGRALKAAERKAIWDVMAAYRGRLEAASLRESEDAFADATALLQGGGLRLPYRAVVVDEAQDLSTAAFRLLRAVVPPSANDLFIVGDGHQRIYGKRVTLSDAGIDIRGRGRNLRVNYRTTEEVRAAAVALLAGAPVDDLDGGEDNLRGYRSLMHGPPPLRHLAATFSAEVDHLADWLRRAPAARSCVVVRTREQRDRYQRALEERGLRGTTLERAAAPAALGALSFATMHRVKGLEFDRVALVGLEEGVLPLDAALRATDDPPLRRAAEQRERALLYVAATRSRGEVLLSAAGRGSGWIWG